MQWLTAFLKAWNTRHTRRIPRAHWRKLRNELYCKSAPEPRCVVRNTGEPTSYRR